MKMIYSVSYPSHILDTLWTSCYIPNKFEVRSRYSSCILFGFLDVRTVFGSHSVCILTEFVWHSMHIPTRLQTLFEQQSSGDAFVRHSKYILNILIIFLLCYDYIPVAFESWYTRNVQESFDAGSQRFLTIRIAFRKKYILSRMWFKFWKLLIPAGSVYIPSQCDGALNGAT